MGIYTKIADDGGKWVEIGADGSGGLSWGDFTTNGDENDSGEWGPDAQGRTWKWAEWSDASKTPTVNLTGGLYRILVASGGAWGNYNGGSHLNSGGDVNDGFVESDPGTYSLQIGKNFYWGISSTTGIPESQTLVYKGNNVIAGSRICPMAPDSYQETGSSVPYRDDQDNNAGRPLFNGYLSDITGTTREYGAIKNVDFANPSGIPVSFGRYNTSGGVIIATVTNDPSEWNTPGQIPGIGGWATITDVTGSTGNRYTYNDGVMDWVAYEFTGSGTIKTSDGLVDVFLISGGGGGSSSRSGNGGDVLRGLHQITDDDHNVVCGRGAEGSASPPFRGQPSSIGPLTTGMASLAPGVTECTGAGATDTEITAGLLTKILGEPGVIYGKGHTQSIVADTNGNGGAPNYNGASGSCLIRVPASNALATIPGTWGDL